MKRGHLSQYFRAIGFKRLSAVEASRHRSNQHEFDGVAGLKKMLGGSRRTFNALFVYLADGESEAITDTGFLTWYDARENHATRSEWRLYFPATLVSARAAEGDLLVIGARPDDSLLVIVAKAGSSMEHRIRWLFSIPELPRNDVGYTLRDEAAVDQQELEFASRLILDQLGIELVDTEDAYLDRMLDRFGSAFPRTAEFSGFARETVSDVERDADSLIVAWIEREEALFRTLEKHLIADRLKEGFDDVDTFISFSLGVQNRRKARAGFALENHLEHLFRLYGLRYTRTARTEGRASPDFLFPGEKEYHLPTFPTARLTMLGVKSSCKDRWRQVLAEADRIDRKHLFTLEPGISPNQTDEMKKRKLQLVLPRAVHATYKPGQRTVLMDLAQFVDLVERRQRTTG